MERVIEVFGIITGIWYLYYEIKHDNRMWYVGIASAIVFAILFGVERLYASMSYQIYYLVMSIYGIYRWREDSTKESMNEPIKSNQTNDSDKIVINQIEPIPAIISVIVSIGVFILIYFFLTDHTNASEPLLDASVTTLSLLATYWLSKSWIYQWWIWIIVNILSIIMFTMLELYLTTFLYVFYTASAFYGYYFWRKNGTKRGLL